MFPVGQQVQISVVFNVSVQGGESLQTAVMVTCLPHGHFDCSVTVQALPVITACALLGACPAHSTSTHTELLVQFVTVPLTVILVGLFAPVPRGTAVMEAGLIEMVHMEN